MLESNNRIGARDNNSKKHIYICPQGCKCKSKDAKVIIKAKSGYTNLYRHLVSCAGKGDQDVVLEMFQVATQRKKLKQALVLDSFSSSIVTSNDLTAVDSPPSKYDEELYEWLVLIIVKNNPLSIVVDTQYRAILKHEKVFSCQLLRQIIFKVRNLVKEKLRKELKSSKVGSILHDGWTKFSKHYMCLLACFNILVSRSVYKKGEAF